MFTVEQIYNDFLVRRNGLLNALVSDLENNQQLSDAVKEEKLCLAGKCDSWLRSVAVNFAELSNFDRQNTIALSALLNDLPTVLEILQGLTSPMKNCGLCEEYVHQNKYWVCCNVCWKFFHGECLGITDDDTIDKHKCPTCNRGIISDLDHQLGTNEETCPICECSLPRVNLNFSSVTTCGECKKKFHRSCAGVSENDIYQCLACRRNDMTNFVARLAAVASQQEQAGSSSTSKKIEEFGEDINWRYCIVCRIWFPCPSSDDEYEEIDHYVCPSCNGKMCFACNGTIFRNENWVSCIECKEKFHVNCDNFSPANNVWMYKCLSCNPKINHQKGNQCRECEKNADFFVTCVICSDQLHGKCLFISPTDHHKIRGYICRDCKVSNNQISNIKTPSIRRVSEL